MSLQLAVALCVLFLHFEYNGISSLLLDDQGYCEFSDEFEDLCSSYCFRSVKPTLGYIMELKDQMKVTAKENIERVEEVKKLRQNLLDIPNNTKDIQDLRQTIDTLKESIEIQNQNIAKIIEFNNNIINNQNAEAQNISKIIATQEDLKTEVEQLKKQIKENPKQSTENSSKSPQTEKDLTECKENLDKSICKDHSTGIYNIKISGIDSFSVLCNEDIADGGWIVIQNRFDGSENFNRSWYEYRNGFGNLEGEFFIGLEKLHQITKQKPYELYIQFGYFDGASKYVRYNNFRIQNENNNYLLEQLTEFNGTKYDGMWLNRNQKFSTYDRDNDLDKAANCAKRFHGAWWFKTCNGPNLNGKYYKMSTVSGDSMSWDGFHALKSVQMLIRSKSTN